MKRYIVAMAGLLLTACTTVSYDLHPKSHFDYPNSNIKPLGQASGEASQISLFLPPSLSGELERQAVQAALSTKPGADILINYTAETKITALAFIYILAHKVQGTAASMSVGVQDLK